MKKNDWKCFWEFNQNVSAILLLPLAIRLSSGQKRGATKLRMHPSNEPNIYTNDSNNFSCSFTRTIRSSTQNCVIHGMQRFQFNWNIFELQRCNWMLVAHITTFIFMFREWASWNFVQYFKFIENLPIFIDAHQNLCKRKKGVTFVHSMRTFSRFVF